METVRNSNTQHIDESSGNNNSEAFRIWRLIETWDLLKIVDSKKTHKYKSISQRKGNTNEIKDTTRWWKQ